MRTLHAATPLVSLMLVAGCATVQDVSLAPSSGNALKDREVTVALHDKPDFTAMTPGAAAFGLVGAAVMIRNGNMVVADNGIDDPASAIAKALSANLEQAYQTHTTTRTARSDWDDVAKLAQMNPGSDMILDVQTTNWTLAYFPTSWGKYRLLYVARARLVDVKRGTVIAQGMCKRIPEDSTNAPGYDDFLANNAALLKQELAVAADECVRSATQQMFAIASPAVVSIARPESAPPAARPAPAPQPELVMAAPPSAGPATAIPANFVRTPLPGDARIPAQRYGLPGIWTGKWDNGLEVTLLVEEVHGRTARVVYSWGVSPRIQGPDKPGFQRVAGEVLDDGTLRFMLRNGAQATYQLSDDGRSLKGRWTRERGVLSGTFEKRELP